MLLCPGLIHFRRCEELSASWLCQQTEQHNLAVCCKQRCSVCTGCRCADEFMQAHLHVRHGNVHRFAAASPSKAARGGGGLLSNGHPAAAPVELEPQLLRRSSAALDSDANGSDTPQSARTRGPSRSDGALPACVSVLGVVHGTEDRFPTFLSMTRPLYQLIP